MAEFITENPLPECPGSPNCVRTHKVFDAGIEVIFEYLSQIFEEDAYKFIVKDPKRIELHAVYRIPLFGFKDDVNVIIEEYEEKTIFYIRSASRVGEYDLGVNKRRVRKIFNKLEYKIKN
ncbi:MAG: DUF1499 domain-containing protein [Gracilimonas sp.]|nr:DUF1499 domain-containing protein [Gracilimonas sp.]